MLLLNYYTLNRLHKELPINNIICLTIFFEKQTKIEQH